MAINNLASGFRPGVVTSTTRPTTPYEGQAIWETDTDEMFVWNGTAWRPLAGLTPACSVTRTTNQSITNAAYNSISWDSEIFDTDSMFAPTSTNITINSAGLYLLTVQMSYASNATGVRITLLEKNATAAGNGTFLCRDIRGAVNGDATFLTMTTQARLAASDTIRLTVYQSSGGALNTSNSAGDLCLTVSMIAWS